MPVFRVTYEIDIVALTAELAAAEFREIWNDPDRLQPAVWVQKQDDQGRRVGPPELFDFHKQEG